MLLVSRCSLMVDSGIRLLLACSDCDCDCAFSVNAHPSWPHFPLSNSSKQPQAPSASSLDVGDFDVSFDFVSSAYSSS